MTQQTAPRLTLVIASLGSGGAERIFTALANRWSDDGCAITVVTLFDESADYYPLHPRVVRLPLGVAGHSPTSWTAVGNNLRRVRRLREAISASRPDAVLSFGDQTNVLTLAATIATGLRVVVSERSNPLLDTPRIWSWARRLLYRRADAVVVQTHGVAKWARRFVVREKVVTIPNFAWIAPLGSMASVARARRVVALGRLRAEKGFDLLLRAFARVADRFPEWELVVGGEGPGRAELEKLRDELGLGQRAQFPGVVRDVGTFLREASVFVLSSRYEGFPNALVEAMASGAACAAFDCDFGPRDIVRDRVDALLLPPACIDSLTSALEHLMSSPFERERLGAAARSIVDRLSLDGIQRRWLSTLVDGAADGATPRTN